MSAGFTVADAWQSSTIDLDGPVHVADFGGSGPTIVCVHGLGGSHLNWLAVAPALTRRAHVLAPDLAGFGRTPTAGRPTTVQANRGLLDRFIREVVGGPVILMGNSMGGMISILQAAQEPETVAGLVLVAPSVPRVPGSRIDPLVARNFATYAIPGLGERFVARRKARLGPEGLLAETMRICCADPSRVPPDVMAAALAFARERFVMPYADAAFLQASRSLVGVLARRGYLDKIRSVTAPTLVVQGALDRLVPIASVRRIAGLRPEWKLEVFEGVGHVPQLEASERFVQTVERWLETDGKVAVTMAHQAEPVGQPADL